MEREVITNDYGDILDRIVARSGGKYDSMSQEERLTVIKIMREMKDEIDRYIKNNYHVVEAWASIDTSEI